MFDHGIENDQERAHAQPTEESSGMIAVQYQALKRLDWLGTHYPGWPRESTDIMVDFYDDQGFLICIDRTPARRTATGDDVRSPGATAILNACGSQDLSRVVVELTTTSEPNL